jgi:hypothetical protein
VRIVLLACLAVPALAQSDEAKFAEGRTALDAHHDCAVALRAFQGISADGQQDPTVLSYLARTEECLRNLKEAVEYYERYAEKVPGQTEIANKIGELRYQLIKQEEGRALASRQAERGRMASSLMQTIGSLVPSDPIILEDRTVGKGRDKISTKHTMTYKADLLSCALSVRSDERYRSAYVKDGDEVGSFESVEHGYADLSSVDFRVAKTKEGYVCMSPIRDWTRITTDEKGNDHEYSGNGLDSFCFGSQDNRSESVLSPTLTDQLQNAIQKAHELCSR